MSIVLGFVGIGAGRVNGPGRDSGPLGIRAGSGVILFDRGICFAPCLAAGRLTIASGARAAGIIPDLKQPCTCANDFY